MHLALLELISEDVCEPWRAFTANVIYKYTKPDACTHSQRGTYTHMHTPNENTLGIGACNFFAIDPAGKRSWQINRHIHWSATTLNYWLLQRHLSSRYYAMFCRETFLPGIHVCITLTQCIAVVLTDASGLIRTLQDTGLRDMMKSLSCWLWLRNPQILIQTISVGCAGQSARYEGAT